MFTAALSLRINAAQGFEDIQLMNQFLAIYRQLGVFPSRRQNSEGQYILIRHNATSTYLTSQGFGKLITYYPATRPPTNSDFEVHLNRAGNTGYFNLITGAGFCGGVASGVTNYYTQMVFTDWCDSITHHFSLVVEGQYVMFLNRANGLCLSHTYQNTCNRNDGNQLFKLCLSSRNTTCYP